MSEEPLRALVGQVRAMKEQVGVLSIQIDALEKQAIAMALTMPRVEPETLPERPRKKYLMGDTGRGPEPERKPEEGV